MGVGMGRAAWAWDSTGEAVDGGEGSHSSRGVASLGLLKG